MSEPWRQAAKPFMKAPTRRVNRSRARLEAVKSTPWSGSVEDVVVPEPLDPRTLASQAAALVAAATRARTIAQRDAEDDTPRSRAAEATEPSVVVSRQEGRLENMGHARD